MDILDIFKKRRIELNITQRELSNKLGMAINAYQKIESKTQDLKLDTFLKLINILEIPITTFLNDDLIIISKEDLNKIKDATELLTTVTEKLNNQTKYSNNSNNITVGDGNTITNSFNRNEDN